jgi:hypothetical protein
VNAASGLILGVGGLGVVVFLWLLAGAAADEKPGPKTSKAWGGVLLFLAFFVAVCALASALWRR